MVLWTKCLTGSSRLDVYKRGGDSFPPEKWGEAAAHPSTGT
jgi:hypothetical protein